MKGLVSEETLVPRQWGGETRKFGLVFRAFIQASSHRMPKAKERQLVIVLLVLI